MEHSKPTPIERDFKNIREVRQNNNNTIVYECLREGDLKKLNKNINKEEYKRTLLDLELTEEDFVSECKDNNLFAKLASGRLSKNASRQGVGDEIEQIRTCNITSQKCGVIIEKLTATELRPTKDGSIVSNDEKKIKKIPKDCCLKSFDAKISGKIKGYMSAKVVIGDGGHQDSVFEEMDNLADWWKKYRSESEEILIILIDTDSDSITKFTKFTTLKEKYINVNNVKVFNHIELQQYMISSYYIDESV